MHRRRRGDRLRAQPTRDRRRRQPVRPRSQRRSAVDHRRQLPSLLQRDRSMSFDDLGLERRSENRGAHGVKNAEQEDGPIAFRAHDGRNGRPHDSAGGIHGLPRVVNGDDAHRDRGVHRVTRRDIYRDRHAVEREGQPVSLTLEALLPPRRDASSHDAAGSHRHSPAVAHHRRDDEQANVPTVTMARESIQQAQMQRVPRRDLLRRKCARGHEKRRRQEQHSQATRAVSSRAAALGDLCLHRHRFAHPSPYTARTGWDRKERPTEFHFTR